MGHHCSGHSVLFYDTESKVDEAAASFIYEGMREGEDAIVIATFKRRAALVPWLVRLGIEAFHKDPPQLLMYDAQSLLSSFMVDGMPDAELFRSTLIPIFKQARPRLRAFGEMVDILAREGQAAAALRLEELWNHEMSARSFSLFCAYSLKSFEASHKSAFDDICREHSQILLPPNSANDAHEIPN